MAIKINAGIRVNTVWTENFELLGRKAKCYV
jgi:hypothetical protein